MHIDMSILLLPLCVERGFLDENLEGGGGTTIVPRSQQDSVASPAAALDAAAGASTLPLTEFPPFLAPLAT
jgi:hypothetical protein